MAAFTFAAVPALTGREPLITWETVAMEKPEAFATSVILGLRFMEALLSDEKRGEKTG